MIDLYDQWGRLIERHPGISENRAAELLGVRAEVLRRTINAAERTDRPTDRRLVAHMLRLHADDLELDGWHRIAARMRLRAVELDRETKANTNA